jgi:hypothetical protein
MIGASGASVLGAASCTSCQRIIHRVETDIQNKMFGHLRIRLGLKQSAAAKSGKGVLFRKGGLTEDFTADPQSLPSAIFVPVYANKPRLWLEPGEDHSPLYKLQLSPVHNPRDLEEMDRYGDVGLELWTDPILYQRFLAKIGLGFATLVYGATAFRSIVGDFILGREKDGYGKYVFSARAGDAPVVPSDGAIWHSILTRAIIHKDATYIISFVTLFANYRTPSNAVIVGLPA